MPDVCHMSAARVKMVEGECEGHRTGGVRLRFQGRAVSSGGRTGVAAVG